MASKSSHLLTNLFNSEDQRWTITINGQQVLNPPGQVVRRVQIGIEKPYYLICDDMIPRTGKVLYIELAAILQKLEFDGDESLSPILEIARSNMKEHLREVEVMNLRTMFARRC